MNSEREDKYTEQGAGEPFAYYNPSDCYWIRNGGGVAFCGQKTETFSEPVYTHPPKPTWDDQAYKNLADEVEYWKSKAADTEAMLERIRDDLGPTHMGEPLLSEPPKPTGGGVPNGLIEFAKRCLQASREGCGADGADIHDWALECDLIEPYQATESCGIECACAEAFDFPIECYRDTSALSGGCSPDEPFINAAFGAIEERRLKGFENDAYRKIGITKMSITESSYVAGLNSAAQYIRAKAAEFDDEHGETDPATGHHQAPAFSRELLALAEEVRLLATQQPPED